MNNQISECVDVPKKHWLKVLQHFKVWCSTDNTMYLVFKDDIRQEGYEINFWLTKPPVYEFNTYYVEEGTGSIIIKCNHTRYIIDEFKANGNKTFGTLKLTDLDNHRESNPSVLFHGISTPIEGEYKVNAKL